MVPTSTPRASRLPAIRPGDIVGRPVPPSILLDASPRQKRDPAHERLDGEAAKGKGRGKGRRGGAGGRRAATTDPNASLSDSAGSSSSFASLRGGMVDFDGIERPSSAVPNDTFKDVPQDVMENVPDALGTRERMDGKKRERERERWE